VSFLSINKPNPKYPKIATAPPFVSQLYTLSKGEGATIIDIGAQKPKLDLI